jgi:hypothetical protein
MSPNGNEEHSQSLGHREVLSRYSESTPVGSIGDYPRLVGDDLLVLRCMLPPSLAGDPRGETYVRSYGLYKKPGLHLTDVVEAALRVRAGEAPALAREIREKYGLDIEALRSSRGNRSQGPGTV